jgi:hypothetical protein
MTDEIKKSRLDRFFDHAQRGANVGFVLWFVVLIVWLVFLR